MIERTPEMSLIAEAMAREPLPPQPVKPERSPKYVVNDQWRASVKEAGGKGTQVIFTPEATRRLAVLKELAGFESQSQLVSAAVIAYQPPGAPDEFRLRYSLEPEARDAIDVMRADWPLESDLEVINLALRWLAFHVESNDLQTLQYGT